MKKLLIVSGLAGSKKQEVANILSKQMNTKILPADSLQIYKNWPISSNWPRDPQNYELIGKYDGLSQFITSFQFKSEFMSILNKTEHPVIEGGCCFFINQLLKKRQEQFTEQEIQIADKNAKQMFLNCSDPQILLKSLCKKYNEQPAITDKYRLIRAIRFALLTNGETYQSPFKIEEPKLSEILDVRGFFLSEPQENICQIIYQRCNEMLRQGILEEFYAFYLNSKTMNADQIRLGTPIGYDIFVELISSFIQINQNCSYSQNRKEIKKRERIKRFVEIFYIKSRQYTAYQRRYVRSNLNQLIWIDNRLNNISEMISTYYNCERQFYNNQLSCIDNIELQSDRNPQSQGQSMKFEASSEIQELVYETLQNMI